MIRLAHKIVFLNIQIGEGAQKCVEEECKQETLLTIFRKPQEMVFAILKLNRPAILNHVTVKVHGKTLVAAPKNAV